MPFNSVIDRDDTEALMPEDAIREIFDNVEQQSVVGQLARRLRNGTRSEMRLPVFEALPMAYFVDSDTGMKQTTSLAWQNVFIRYGEIAVITPIPENVFDDSEFPVWDQAVPHITGAINQVFDRAVFYKEGAPSNWPDSLLDQIVAHGHDVSPGEATSPDAPGSPGELYDDLLGVGGVLNLVEEDGYVVTGHAAHPNMKARLRQVRSDNVPLFANVPGEAGRNRYTLDGEPIVFAMNGSLDKDVTPLISGDWRQLVWSVRQDVTWKMLDQAVLTDNASPPNIIYNLPQQDMIALRVKFRVGWALPNPPTRLNPNDSTRFPFAALIGSLAS